MWCNDRTMRHHRLDCVSRSLNMRRALIKYVLSFLTSLQCCTIMLQSFANIVAGCCTTCSMRLARGAFNNQSSLQIKYHIEAGEAYPFIVLQIGSPLQNSHCQSYSIRRRYLFWSLFQKLFYKRWELRNKTANGDHVWLCMGCPALLSVLGPGYGPEFDNDPPLFIMGCLENEIKTMIAPVSRTQRAVYL